MQHERKKTREDTWKSDELKKHLKTTQADKQYEDKKYKERRPVRDEDKDERAERRRTSSDQEQKEERRHHKNPERDRYEDYTMEVTKDHYREKDKVRERDREKDREKHHSSEKHKTSERDKASDRKYREQVPRKVSLSKEHGGSEEKDLRRREMVESLEKPKQRSADRERRHQERREKEGKRQEMEDYGEQELKPRKPRDDLGVTDVERERKKNSGNAEMAKRHRNRQEKEDRGQQLLKEESLDRIHALERMKPKSHSERRHDEERERRHKEKREHRAQPSERRKSEVSVAKLTNHFE
ncbi:uncharacterized protein O3C94_007215 [Discoglossus pictus]